MPATTNKQQLLNTTYTALRKKFGARDTSVEPPRPVLEEVIYAILRENATSEEADVAYAGLRKTFLDWNEVRVSTVQEIADILKPLDNAGQRARRIIGLLQKVFEEEYSFSLEELGKKGLKQAAKQLSRYKEEVNDFIVAWVVQRARGGHSIPLDDRTLRALIHSGIIQPSEAEDAESIEALRATIEHVVPKNRGPELTELLSLHARELVLAEEAAKRPPASEERESPKKSAKDKKIKKPR